MSVLACEGSERDCIRIETRKREDVGKGRKREKPERKVFSREKGLVRGSSGVDQARKRSGGKELGKMER